MLIGLIMGQSQLTHHHPVAVVGIVSLANSVLALPLVPLARWALPEPERSYPWPPR